MHVFGRFLLVVVVLLLTIFCLPMGSRAAWPEVETYTQEIELTFASPEQAAAATLVPVPVLGGKPWALSARWDDNHFGSVTMHDLMAKHGLKGTFYVNGADSKDRFGQAFIDKLTPGGFTIGGHTQTHPFLPMLGANAVFTEILANRVQREAQADSPVISFAPSFGAWQSDHDPQAAQRVTESLRRAGFHHNTYNAFAQKNPHAAENEFSTCCLIQPGDHTVDRAKFETNLEKFFKFPAAYQKISYNITLATHARQQGKAWEDLDALYADLVKKADWWICNQNEFAAYFLQVQRTKIERVGVTGSTARFKLTRPTPESCGAIVPLTVEITGGGATNVNTAAAAAPPPHELFQKDGRTLLNLAHDPDQALPQKIDVVDNPTNAAAPADGKDAVAELPGLHAWLSFDAASHRLTLQLRNASDQPLIGATITLRVPLAYSPSNRLIKLPDLPPGNSHIEPIDLGPARDSAEDREGPLYFVAELNFLHGGQRQRIFATTTLAQPSPARSSVRDAAVVVGPLALADLDASALASLSKPAAPLAALGEGPNQRWFTVSAADRQRFIGERLVLFRDADPAWLAACKPFNQQDHAFLAAIDFRVDQPGAVKLTSELPVRQVFLDGQPVSADQALSITSAGEHRLLIVLGITDKRVYFKSMPAWFSISTDGASVEYLLPKQ